jgi:hypothetical protein
MKTFKGTPSIPDNPESTIFMPGTCRPTIIAQGRIP